MHYGAATWTIYKTQGYVDMHKKQLSMKQQEQAHIQARKVKTFKVVELKHEYMQAVFSILVEQQNHDHIFQSKHASDIMTSHSKVNTADS